MIDINILRTDKGGDPELVKQSQLKRGDNAEELISKIVKLDDEWKKQRFMVDKLNRRINEASLALKNLIKSGLKDGEEWKACLIEKEHIAETKKTHCAQMDKVEEELKVELSKVGNIISPDVVVSSDEADNKIIRTWAPDPNGIEHPEVQAAIYYTDLDQSLLLDSDKLKTHNEVLSMIDGYDPVRGAKVAGHRGYFLLGAAVDLNLALIQYGLDFLEQRGYTKIWTPFLMKKTLMEKTAELADFDESLFRIEDPNATGDTEKYLIATSEQPISAFHAGEWFIEPSKELPKLYAGTSTCFRREAGAHGKDTWGVFRVHQFEKVEQFVITDPEDSWDYHEKMISISEEFYQSLGIPYRVVSIVSGALNKAAAKKYDLEAWFPVQKMYKELVSCSNCTDYQSRALDIRCGSKKMNEQVKKYVHCLNATLVATERALSCIIENFQTKNGVYIPKILKPYLKNKDFLSYSSHNV